MSQEYSNFHFLPSKIRVLCVSKAYVIFCSFLHQISEKITNCNIWSQCIKQKCHYVTFCILGHISLRRQHLYLVASLIIPLTLPPCLALSQRRTVWCLREEKKDGAHSKRDFSCKSNLSYCYRVVWMKRIAIKNHVCIFCVERTGSISLLALTAFLLLCLSYTSLITTPLPAVTLVPLLCSHISNPTFFCPLCLLHLCNPSLSSLSQPPFSFISFYLLSPLCLLSPFLLSTH